MAPNKVLLAVGALERALPTVQELATSRKPRQLRTARGGEPSAYIVALDVGAVRKGGSAIRKIAAVGLIARVDTHVTRERALLCELFVAIGDLAHVWTLACVPFLRARRVRARGERAVAGAPHLMATEREARVEDLGATGVWALKRLLFARWLAHLFAARADAVASTRAKPAAIAAGPAAATCAAATALHLLQNARETWRTQHQALRSGDANYLRAHTATKSTRSNRCRHAHLLRTRSGGRGARREVTRNRHGEHDGAPQRVGEAARGRERHALLGGHGCSAELRAVLWRRHGEGGEARAGWQCDALRVRRLRAALAPLHARRILRRSGQREQRRGRAVEQRGRVSGSRSCGRREAARVRATRRSHQLRSQAARSVTRGQGAAPASSHARTRARAPRGSAPGSTFHVLVEAAVAAQRARPRFKFCARNARHAKRGKMRARGTAWGRRSAQQRLGGDEPHAALLQLLTHLADAVLGDTPGCILCDRVSGPSNALAGKGRGPRAPITNVS